MLAPMWKLVKRGEKCEIVCRINRNPIREGLIIQNIHNTSNDTDSSVQKKNIVMSFMPIVYTTYTKYEPPTLRMWYLNT